MKRLSLMRQRGLTFAKRERSNIAAAADFGTLRAAATTTTRAAAIANFLKLRLLLKNEGVPILDNGHRII